MKKKSIAELKEDLAVVQQEIKIRKTIKKGIKKKLSSAYEELKRKAEDDEQGLGDWVEKKESNPPEETEGLEKLVPDDEDEHRPIADQETDFR